VGRTWSYQCLLLAISAWLLAVKSMLNPMFMVGYPFFAGESSHAVQNPSSAFAAEIPN